jgi:hypothetical protein
MLVSTMGPVESSTSVYLTKARVKLASIAIANKLLRQCFAITESGRPYNEMYVSALPKSIEEKKQ